MKLEAVLLDNVDEISFSDTNITEEDCLTNV